MRVHAYPAPTSCRGEVVYNASSLGQRTLNTRTCFKKLSTKRDYIFCQKKTVSNLGLRSNSPHFKFGLLDQKPKFYTAQNFGLFNFLGFSVLRVPGVLGNSRYTGEFREIPGIHGILGISRYTRSFWKFPVYRGVSGNSRYTGNFWNFPVYREYPKCNVM